MDDEAQRKEKGQVGRRDKGREGGQGLPGKTVCRGRRERRPEKALQAASAVVLPPLVAAARTAGVTSRRFPRRQAALQARPPGRSEGSHLTPCKAMGAGGGGKGIREGGGRRGKGG